MTEHDEEVSRYLPIECDEEVSYIVTTPDYALFVTQLMIGCDCHPEFTQITQRRHCLN